MDEYATAASSIYLGIAVLFALATYLEGWHRRDGWDSGRVVGLVACAAWPLLLVAVACSAAMFNRRRDLREQE